jgi:hypothetical protein
LYRYTLDEVLAPVDEMASFLSHPHNLFTPYMVGLSVQV